MTIILINNEDTYKKYLNEVEDLIDKDPPINTPDGERLALLAIAIKEYEKKHFSFKKPTPIEAIRFRMEQQDLKQNDLIPYIGSKSKVSEILSGKRKLTIPMIRTLHKYLGISLDVLIQESKQEQFKLTLDDLDYSMFPITEMINRKWIPLAKKYIPENARELINSFFKPVGSLTSQGVMWRRSFHSRGEDDTNKYSLIAWSIRIMILAKEERVEEYNKDLINMDYLREIAKLSQFNQGPLLAKEMLAKNGIKLIFQAQLPKTKIDGGCFLDKEGNPVIGMTLRFDRIDNFWHTLLHEMAHIYKHLTNIDSKEFFIDNLQSDPKDDPKEKEADKIAKEAFIPRSIWNRSNALLLQTEDAILELAKKVSIHPAIIAGRISFETNNYSKFSELINRNKVKEILKGHIHE